MELLALALAEADAVDAVDVAISVLVVPEIAAPVVQIAAARHVLVLVLVTVLVNVLVVQLQSSLVNSIKEVIK